MCQMKSKNCSGNAAAFPLKEADRWCWRPLDPSQCSPACTWDTASNSSIYSAMMEDIQKNPSPATVKWVQQHQPACACRLTVP